MQLQYELQMRDFAAANSRRQQQMQMPTACRGAAGPLLQQAPGPTACRGAAVRSTDGLRGAAAAVRRADADVVSDGLRPADAVWSAADGVRPAADAYRPALAAAVAAAVAATAAAATAAAAAAAACPFPGFSKIRKKI